MKIMLLTFFTASVVCVSVWGDSPEMPLEVLRYGPVNDQVVDGLTPCGLVQTKSGDLITTFIDRGDAAAGAKSYLVRSKDQGKTWSKPFRIIKPATPNEGLHTPIVQLPDGTLMLMINRISHVNSKRENVFNIRESKIELQISQDNGKSFQSIGFFTIPPKSLTATMGSLYQLQNGDLIIPAYCTPGSPRRHPGYQYGSGFFRSVDGGKHWGPLEVVFTDPPTKKEVKQGFNEGAFVVREDGTLIAYARVDVHKGEDYKMNNLWMCQSKDHGLTWTKPMETQITGIYPSIKKLPSGQFVMLCGLRNSKVCRRTTSLLTSKDGINWKYRGHPYYSRTSGIPHNPATGGGQAMVSMGDDTIYVVFYACDPRLPGYHKTYVDGGLLKL